MDAASYLDDYGLLHAGGTKPVREHTSIIAHRLLWERPTEGIFRPVGQSLVPD